MIGGAKGIGLGIDLGLVNQYNRTGSQSYIEPEVLDSLVGVWSAYGMTNDSPNRSTIKNKLSNKGGDFVISNAAYDKMSSYGGYNLGRFDKSWASSSSSNTSIKVVQRNPYDITLKKLGGNSDWEFNNAELKVISNPVSVKFKSNKNIRVTCDYHYYPVGGNSQGTPLGITSKDLIANKDAIITISPISQENIDKYNIDVNRAYYLIYFQLSSTLAVNEEVTIEMLPLFEGAFVTDGIDDLITSTKTVQEMLGGSNEITVVSMIHQVKDSSNNVSFTNYIRGSANGYFRNIVNNYDKTGIYGYTSSDLMGLSVVNNILGDKNDYTSNGDNRDSIINGNFSVQGYSYNDGNNTGDFSSVAWYWTIIANKVLTTDQINQVIAYFNLDRTLKSDIYCNIAKQGITNENHAEFGDKLIDYSGNGRDIQLNNIAWKGDSGIGKYSADFGSFDWAVNISQKQHNKATISLNGRLCNHTAIEVDEMKVNIIGNVTELIYWYIANPDDTTRSEIRLTSGINTLPKSYAKDDGQTYNIGFAYISGDSEITIEQIPSHAGGLCLDGVNDFGKVTGMPIYKDYTVIADYIRTFAKENVQDAPILSKSKEGGDGAFIFNYVDYSTSKTLAYSFANINNVSYINDFERNIYYQSKYTNNGNSINAGTGVDTNSMWLGTYRDNVQNYFTGAIYSLMSFPYSMSEFLIERQLKKYKLGTLYPDMVEFRPIVKSNLPYSSISYSVNPGEYISVDSMVTITVTLPNTSDKLMEVSCNAISDISISGDNGVYEITGKVGKSPQKINMIISSYLTMLSNSTLISNETLIKNE